MSEPIKPTQASRKEKDLAEESGDCGTCEALFSALENVACKEGNEGIDQEKSSGHPEELSDSAGAGWIEHRQSGHALEQIKHQSGEAAAASEQESDQQDAEVLNCQRHRSQRRQGNGDARAQGYEQACSDHERNLPRGFEYAFRRRTKRFCCPFCHHCSPGRRTRSLQWRVRSVRWSPSDSAGCPSWEACNFCRCRRR